LCLKDHTNTFQHHIFHKQWRLWLWNNTRNHKISNVRTQSQMRNPLHNMLHRMSNRAQN